MGGKLFWSTLLPSGSMVQPISAQMKDPVNRLSGDILLDIQTVASYAEALPSRHREIRAWKACLLQSGGAFACAKTQSLPCFGSEF
jgi:hypothetical protein